MNSLSRRELAFVLAWAAVPTLLFLDKPFHMDEAWFMALARRAAEAPLDPLGFSINLYGHTAPASEHHAYGLLVAYLMAPGAALAGTRDWLMRLLYLPVELAAAGFLYAFAGRFLKKPLVPVLLVLASPLYWLNVHLLTAERWVAAFGFAALYAAARAAKGDRRWLAASAAAFAAATASKYTALVLAVPAAAVLFAGRVPPADIAWWAAVSASPALAAAAATLFGGYRGGRVAVQVSMSGLEGGSWRHWIHRGRAVAALLGGGTLFLSAWPWRSVKREPRAVLAAGAVAAALFLPWFDLAAVRPVDRLLGAALAFGAAMAMASAAARLREDDGAVWASWLAAVLALQAVYWSVVSRSVLLAVPPLVFSLAAAAERRGRALPAAAAGAVLLFGLALGSVDARYARAQKDIAALVKERYLSAGRTVWYTGHWGFQHYMSQAGAKPIEEGSGWDAARPGDVVAVPANNTNIVHGRPRLADVSRIAVDHPLPLRLMSAGAPEAGFYSSAFGFLPFSFSREPVDEFTLVELR